MSNIYSCNVLKPTENSIMILNIKPTKAKEISSEEISLEKEDIITDGFCS